MQALESLFPHPTGPTLDTLLLAHRTLESQSPLLPPVESPDEILRFEKVLAQAFGLDTAAALLQEALIVTTTNWDAAKLRRRNQALAWTWGTLDFMLTPVDPGTSYIVGLFSGLLTRQEWLLVCRGQNLQLHRINLVGMTQEEGSGELLRVIAAMERIGLDEGNFGKALLA